MSFDSVRLFELLPTVLRLRDGASGAASPNALRALMDVIASQVAVLEEDLDQLYDDQFVETCATWVAPYIGDLIGYRALYGVTDAIGSPRAEVANTIAFRRRKGTATMLEQLARDVTGWDARVVEYFQHLSTTQYMNHLRPQNVAWVHMGRGALTTIGTPFDTVTHTADVRRIARRRGRYNIPNVGVHLWRIRDQALQRSPAVKLMPGPADGRYLINPVGCNLPLFNHAVAESTISHLAERSNVPQPITRRELWNDLAVYYPVSVAVHVDGITLPASVVAASDLSDHAGGWAYSSTTSVLIDPELGRLSLPPSLTIDGRNIDLRNPSVSFHYGAPAEMGGGQYSRASSINATVVPVVPVTMPGTLTAALGTLAGSGAIEIRDNGRYAEPLAIAAPAGARIEVRAADGHRPTILPGAELVITLADGADVTLNGLLLTGTRIRIPASSGSGTLRLRHCTLVPGIGRTVDGAPLQPQAPSLVVDADAVTLDIEHCIVGGIRAHEDAVVRVRDSIVDATDPSHVAYAAPDGIGAAGEVEFVDSTVIGKVHARVLRTVSNSILDARLATGDPWTFPVHAERRQEGCVRFSFVPLGSRTPRRYRCQPETVADASRVQPQYTSEQYGAPAYLQLSDRCASEIRTGADDESEMGAYHDLYAPQRETNLGVRLDEYLRFGLDAGVFHAS
jgi:hypothetical protein